MKPWLLALVAKAGHVYETARRKARDWKQAGIVPDEAVLAAFCAETFAEFDPRVRGRAIVDHEIRAHLGAAMARLALNVLAAETHEEAA